MSTVRNFAPRLGQSLAELTLGAARFDFDRYAAAPVTFESIPFAMVSGIDGGSGDFFSGLGLRPAAMPDANLPQPPLEATTAMRLAALQTAAMRRPF